MKPQAGGGTRKAAPEARPVPRGLIEEDQATQASSPKPAFDGDFTNDVVVAINSGARQAGTPEEDIRMPQIIAGRRNALAMVDLVELYSPTHVKALVEREGCIGFRAGTRALTHRLKAEDPWLVIGSPPCTALRDARVSI